MVRKGNNPDVDSYSAFFDNKKLSKTEMDEVLKAHGVTDCFVCGIAYDVCVGNDRCGYISEWLLLLHVRRIKRLL